MSHPQRIGRQTVHGQRGFTIIETVVSTALLGILTLTALGGLLFGMAQARGGQNRAGAASWSQAELDYLLVQGYTNLIVGTRTLPSGGYGTYGGGIAEPVIPAGFDRATITITQITGMLVKQVTVTLYQTPSSTAYTTLSTYISSYSHL